MPLTRIEVRTHAREELVDVTDRLREAVRQAGLRDGAVLVASQHTTAGVTVQENADPDVVRDLLLALSHAAPDAPPGGRWRHAEGNTPAHVKTTLVGASQLVPVEDGELALGTWQGVYLCEFDGPRARELVLAFLPAHP
jgi:secondary thiamine-phosphate synthase enzyme